MAQNGAYAAQASDEALAKVLSARLATIRALQAEDVGLCAKFAFANLEANDGAELSPKAERTKAEAAAVQLTAIADGKARQMRRQDLGPADLKHVISVLERKGASQTTFKIITSPTPTIYPAADQCEAGVSFYEAAETLPAPEQARWVVAALGPADK